MTVTMPHAPEMHHYCHDDDCCGLSLLTCVACKEDWPCTTKREHLKERGKPYAGHLAWRYSDHERFCTTCYDPWPCGRKREAAPDQARCDAVSGCGRRCQLPEGHDAPDHWHKEAYETTINGRRQYEETRWPR